MMTTQQRDKEITERITELEVVRQAFLDKAEEYRKRIAHLEEMRDRFNAKVQFIPKN